MAILSTVFGIAASAGDGADAWQSPFNALQNQGTSTSCDTTSKNSSPSTLVVSNTTLNAMPRASAIIEGIEVKILKSCSLSNDASDSVVRLALGTTQNNIGAIGNNQSDPSYWPTSDTLFEYGGPTDLWGLTQAQLDSIFNNGIINQFFGLHVKPSQGSSTTRIKTIEVIIHYRINDTLVMKNGSWVIAEPKQLTAGSFSTLPEIQVRHNNANHIVYRS